MTMTVLGAIARPQLPPERLRSLARTADEAGLDELWLWEDCFWGGGIAAATAALASTERLCVGIGVHPVPLRNVALTAMEMSMIHRLFPQRAIFGVGHGVQEWMAQVGARVEFPMTLLREHLTALRSLLNGELVTTHGRYVQLDRVALDWPPTTPPALLSAARGPRTLRLSGELADGTILTSSTSPDALRSARSLVDEGRAQGGLTQPHRIVIYLLAATGSGCTERLEREQVSGTGVAGDAHAVADAVERWLEAGADTVVLQPTVDDPDPEGFVRFAADEVRPLLG